VIQYTLKAFNGGLQNSQSELVSSTIVTLNGVQVIGANNFNQNVAEVDVPVTLQASDTLSVQVRGQPGGILTIQVVGVDTDPPSIRATVSPAPNAAAWNSTNLTVTFSCSDATSGVASCPSARVVTMEGGGQFVSGVATDNAGNTASTTVTLNIDKTSPVISYSISPVPNASGVNTTTPVTIAFTCSDRQQPAGQKTIFYVDGPGPSTHVANNNGCLVGFSPIDSMIWWVNFKVKFSNQAENYSKTVYFYQKLVVNPGRHLDYVHSIGKTGRLP